MTLRRTVSRDLLVLARRQEGLVSTAQTDVAGVSGGRRARLVREGTWTRPARGVYDTAPASRRPPEDERRRSAWLGLLAHGPDAIAVGASALALHGVAGLPLTITPEVALPRGSHGRSSADVRVRCFGRATPVPAVRRGTARLVPLPWALAQALPELPQRNAVAVLDDVLHRRLLHESELGTVRGLVARRRGAAGTHRLWSLVDGRAESPLESFARLDCVDAGLTPDELQVAVRSADGRVIGRGDLGWRTGADRWLIAEIDGRSVHEEPTALLHDRRRQNALLGTGRVDVVRFTAADLGPDGHLVRTLRARLSGRARR